MTWRFFAKRRVWRSNRDKQIDNARLHQLLTQVNPPGNISSRPCRRVGDIGQGLDLPHCLLYERLRFVGHICWQGYPAKAVEKLLVYPYPFPSLVAKV